MANNCLETKLKASVQNDNLVKLGEIKYKVLWNDATTISLYYGGLSAQVPVDYVIKLNGGTINGQNTATVVAGTNQSQYSHLTIDKVSGETELYISIQNKYNIDGFGIGENGAGSRWSTDSGFYKTEDVYLLLNATKINLDAVNTYNLSTIVEKLIGNGRSAEKTQLIIWCYGDKDYDVYPGDTKINVANKNITIVINAAQTEYVLKDGDTVLAKKVYSGGSWINVTV